MFLFICLGWFLCSFFIDLFLVGLFWVFFGYEVVVCKFLDIFLVFVCNKSLYVEVKKFNFWMIFKFLVLFLFLLILDVVSFLVFVCKFSGDINCFWFLL